MRARFPQLNPQSRRACYAVSSHWRKRGLIASGLLAVLFALVLLVRPDHGPKYHGRSLRHWLITYYDAPAGSAEEVEADAALRHLGTNAAPYAIRWMKYREDGSGLMDRTRSAVLRHATTRKFAPLRNWAESEEDFKLAYISPRIFELLGPEGAPFIPELTRWASNLREDENQESYVESLAAIGPSALPALLSLAANSDSPARWSALMALAELGTNAAPAIPMLIASLNDPDVAVPAAMALGSIGLEPDRVIPALTNRLYDVDPSLRRFIMTALGDYGSDATNSLPVLLRYLADTNQQTRRTATNAIRRIAPETLR